MPKRFGEFEQEPKTTGPELGDFHMNDLIYIPGEPEPRKIVGIDHPNQSFLLETADHEYPVRREKVSLQRLQLYRELTKKRLSPRG